ncbi:MAG: PhoH family protein [Clostridium sp.]|nr:PhoH family protein [Clostridium sp.]
MKETTWKMDMPSEHMQKIFGARDAYLKKLERDFQVTVVNRNGTLRISGNEGNVKKAGGVLGQLMEVSRRGGEIEEQSVDYSIAMWMEGRRSMEEGSFMEEKHSMEEGTSMEERENVLARLGKDIICHAMNGRPITPKTLGQKQYVDAMREHMVVLGLGPAGTGKTYLAMAMAITAFQSNEVSRIILTRPALEAGEKLGFLPGDLQSKIDPYLRPLYDALCQIMGAESFTKNMEKGLIEVAPLAYMRGRTLDNAYIILDEAQNTTPAQMKMFLTRIGFGSKVVVTGDPTQKDLPAGSMSGLDVACKVLGAVPEIAFCKLTGKDVVRHPLVQKIVKAYEEFEGKEKSGRKRKGKSVSRRAKA